MLRYLTILSLLPFMWSCGNSIDRSLPNGDPEILNIDLGGFSLSTETATTGPYFDRSSIIMKNENGEEISFFMTQPSFVDQFSVSEEYPDPQGDFKEINYTYTAQRYEFEFLCAPYGVKFEVELINSLCGDPMRDTDDVVKDHLKITALGFNNPNNQIPFPNPILDIQLEDRLICTGSGQYYPNFTLGEKTYNEVYYSKVTYGGLDIEVFYSIEDGIIAYRDFRYNWVLDRVQ